MLERIGARRTLVGRGYELRLPSLGIVADKIERTASVDAVTRDGFSLTTIVDTYG